MLYYFIKYYSLQFHHILWLWDTFMFLSRISVNYQVFVIVWYLMYGDGDSMHLVVIWYQSLLCELKRDVINVLDFEQFFVVSAAATYML